MLIPVWEQLATDQTDPWQDVPRQVFTPYDCLLISVAFVVLCRVGYLWVTSVIHVIKLVRLFEKFSSKSDWYKLYHDFIDWNSSFERKGWAKWM